MNTLLNIDINTVIKQAENYCDSEGIEVDLVYKLSIKELEIISKRSLDLPMLYFVTVPMLQKRIQNGCFILKKEGTILGHIFAHEHLVKEHAVYERSSLWVNNDYRNYNLGLLLMAKMTELFTESFLISIAQTPKVHHYNKLLGMTHVTLSEMSAVLIKELEKLGKLRDEFNYKYFVNAPLDDAIRNIK